jgi:hypothetical protein
MAKITLGYAQQIRAGRVRGKTFYLGPNLEVVKICHVYNSTYLKYIFLFLYSKHQTLNDITNKIHV